MTELRTQALGTLGIMVIMVLFRLFGSQSRPGRTIHVEGGASGNQQTRARTQTDPEPPPPPPVRRTLFPSPQLLSSPHNQRRNNREPTDEN